MLSTEEDFLKAEIERLKGNITTLNSMLLDVYKDCISHELTVNIDIEDIHVYLEDEGLLPEKTEAIDE